MPQPSTQDLVPPFDPTGYATLTGAQLLQLITGTTPYLNQGMTVWTADIGGVPQVPAANVNTKWQRYIWIRVQPAAVSAYLWNQNGITDPTYSNWVPMQGAIAALSILGSMIAENTITADKIVGIDWSQITSGVPAGFTPGGVAGGSLAGVYPNPTIAPLAVTGANIANQTITSANIASNSITANLMAPGSVSIASVVGPPVNIGDLVGVTSNVGNGVLGYFVPKLITQLTNPGGVGDAGKVPTVNNAGNGFQLSAPTVITKVLQSLQTVDYNQFNFIPGTALASTITLPTSAISTLANGLTVNAFPLKSAASTVDIEVMVNLTVSATEVVFIALFRSDNGTPTNAVAATLLSINPGTSVLPVQLFLRYSYQPGTVGFPTYTVGIGGASNAYNIYYNTDTSSHNLLGGLISSSIKVTERL